jgi:hypothetical protein
MAERAVKGGGAAGAITPRCRRPTGIRGWRTRRRGEPSEAGRAGGRADPRHGPPDQDNERFTKLS